jgi:hypothetical protein
LRASFDAIFIAIHHCVRAGKIAKDRRSRREFMLRHIVASDRQYYISLRKVKYRL